METLLLLTYGAICIAVFKAFKIPLNKWTVPTAVLGGIVLVGMLVLLMNFNHPYADIARKYVPTTPIIPEIAGIVTDVPVKGNMSLKAGDVLFQIEPAPFAARVSSIQGQLQSATLDLERAQELEKRNVGSQRSIDVTQARVTQLAGELEIARYQLDETTVRAPSDGYVTQVLLHPGMRVNNMAFRPGMVFVHKPDTSYIAWFWQNNAGRIEPGLDADIAFDAIPGTVFSAEVVEVMPMLAEGQLVASGNLIGVDPKREYAGRVPVILKVTDPRFDAYRDKLPGGAFAQAAVYSEHMHHLAMMRKILLRMAAWMNYLFPFH